MTSAVKRRRILSHKGCIRDAQQAMIVGLRAVLAFVAVALCVAQQAQLLVQKVLPESALLHEKNSSIHYVIINNGKSAATGVLLEDNLGTTAFAAVTGASPDGTISHLIDSIAPGAKHVISQDVTTLMPPGEYMLPRATVIYTLTNADGEAEERRVFSTTLRARVLTHQQFLKENAKSGAEWLVVLVGYGVAGLAPLYVWLQTRAQNQKQSAKKKSS